jgi:hypothetical protein
MKLGYLPYLEVKDGWLSGPKYVDNSNVVDYNQNIDPSILDEEPNGVTIYSRMNRVQSC